MTTLSRGETRALGGRPLRASLYGDLVWSRPGLFRRELLLEAGSEGLASLRWEKLLSFEATAESADGRWIIGRHRMGSLRGQMIVREAATGAQIAVFDRSWRGTGTVQFASGARYRWERDGFWRPTYFWTTDGERGLLSFKFLFGLTHRIAMEVDPAAREVAELPVLVLLGGYVMAILAARRRRH